MKRFPSAVALLMGLCLISANVIAQDEPAAGRGGRGGRGAGGPGGPGGPGGFGRGGMMGGMMGGGAMQLLGLLRMEEVRKEVNLPNEAYEAIQKSQQEAFAGMGNMRDASEEERAKMMKDLNTKAQELLDEVVDPAGLKRLMGLLLQQQGNTAVVNELIAKEVGLTEADVKALTEAVTKASEEGREKMREMFQGGGAGAPPDREKMTAMMAEMRKKTDGAIEEKLTAEQKTAIEALRGEKFTFPEGGGFGGRGGPGGPGGARPGGAGRARPGSDN